jgi:hypothetical protein
MKHGQWQHAPGCVRLRLRRHRKRYLVAVAGDGGGGAGAGAIVASDRRRCVARYEAEMAVQELRVRDEEVVRVLGLRRQHQGMVLLHVGPVAGQGRRRGARRGSRGRRGGLLPLLLRRGRALPALLLVGDTARLGLAVADLAEVEAHGAGPEGVGLGPAPVLLEGGAEAAHERVEAAPRLPERAGARRRRRGVAEEGASRGVDLGLAELVEVAQELEHVRAAAAGQLQRGAVVAKVLPERVPVAALLRLVAARTRRLRRTGGRAVRRASDDLHAFLFRSDLHARDHGC